MDLCRIDFPFARINCGINCGINYERIDNREVNTRSFDYPYAENFSSDRLSRILQCERESLADEIWKASRKFRVMRDRETVEKNKSVVV